MTEQYKVRLGDCVSKIGFERGIAPDTIWNDPGNADLKQKRKDLSLLLPDDVVVIPDKKLKESSLPAKKLHRFRRKQVPAVLRLRVTSLKAEQSPAKESRRPPPRDDLDAVYKEEDKAAKMSEKPRANCPYSLDIDGDVRQGTTDGDGRLEESIPPDARQLKLTLDPGKPEETVYEMELGTTCPVDTTEGVKRRLANLGFYLGEIDDQVDDSFAFSLSLFQASHGLKVTGESDQATQDKLKTLHGC